VSTLEESRKKTETQTPLPLQTIKPPCPWHSRNNLLKTPFHPLENTSSIRLSKGKKNELFENRQGVTLL
jgi:hypothetical protein